MRVRPHESGGSHVEVHIERSFHGPGVLLQTLLTFMGGSKFFRKSFQQTIEILERETASLAATV